jgi:hypothetical protein
VFLGTIDDNGKAVSVSAVPALKLSEKASFQDESLDCADNCREEFENGALLYYSLCFWACIAAMEAG